MTAVLTPEGVDERWGARLGGTLAVLCAALFLDSLDVSMVGIALPSIRNDLHLSTSALQWIVSGYVLGYGGLLLLGGRVADLMGRRRVFLIALGVFAVATLIGGLVSDPTLLIATRFIKGASAALTAPAGMSIITTTFPEGRSRNRALSIYTACAAGGFSMGLVLSGLLTEVSWRWTFLLPAPIAALALAAGLRLIARDPSPEQGRRHFDVLGATTVTAGLLLLVYTITEGPNAGWASARTLAGFLVTAALLGSFVVVELRSAHPLLRLGLLRSRLIASANLAGFLFQGSYMGFQFIATLYMQSLLGWNALQTALAFLPAGVIVGLVSPRVGVLVSRFGSTRLMVAGFLLLVACYANFLRIGEHSGYASVVLPTVVLVGSSFALTFSCLNIQATSRVADHEQGMASGLVNTSLQIGGAVILAGVTAVVTAGTGSGTSAAAQLDGYRPGMVAVLAVAATGLAASLFTAYAGRRHTASATGVAAAAGEIPEPDLTLYPSSASQAAEQPSAGNRPA